MDARHSTLVRCGLEQLAIWISCSGKIGLYITHASKTVHTLDQAWQCPQSIASVATGTTSPWTAESRRLWHISGRFSCRPRQSCRTAAFYKIEDSRTEGIFQRIPLRVTCSKSTTTTLDVLFVCRYYRPRMVRLHNYLDTWIFQTQVDYIDCTCKVRHFVS